MGYSVATTKHSIGGDDYYIRALSDRRQYWDPAGDAERAGISSAAWPLFGLVWPAGLALADEMSRFACAGKRILEIGCGLGVGSLVLQRRRADITATDHHPLAEEFLRANAARNGLPPITFRLGSWTGTRDDLGRFDVIIASDVLYERGHPAELAAFVGRHAAPGAEIILADPGRAHRARFSTEMRDGGYSRSERRRVFPGVDAPARTGQIMRFVQQTT